MAISDVLEILSRSELFNKFSPEALRLLAFTAESRSLQQGDVLFKKGDSADCGYLVKGGTLALSGATPDERRPVMAGPGVLIGKLALFIRNTRPVTAVAVEPTEVLRIAPTMLRRILEEYPECARVAHDAVRQDLENTTRELNGVRPLFDDDVRA